MPFRKGQAKIGGRRSGSKNRRTRAMDAKIDELTRAKQEFQAALAGEMKFTPLQVMHAIMLLRIGQGDHEGALMAAREAAPYCHARLNAADVRVQHSIGDRPDSEIAAE